MTTYLPRALMPPLRIGTVLTVLVILCATSAALSPASAQSQREIEILGQRVERLQRELNMLQRRVYSGEAPAPDAAQGTTAGATTGSGEGGEMAPNVAARLQTRIGQISEEVQRLTGQLEEARHELRQLGDRLEKLSSDVDFRLTEIEKRLAARAQGAGDEGGEQPAGAEAGDGGQAQARAGQGETGAGQAPGDRSGTIGTVPQEAVDAVRSEAQQARQSESAGGDYTLPDAPADEQYQHAFSLLRQADYDKAERALAAFLDAHPKHELAGNAKYWLGESYYVRGDYEMAAVTFAEGFKSYADSPKAPDNLLKLGMSLAQIDRKEDACGIFAELLKRYPDAAGNILDKARREQQRLSCGS